MRSLREIVLLLSTFIGGVAAGTISVRSGGHQSDTNASVVADRAQTPREWTVAPVEQLDSTSSGSELVAARLEVQRQQDADKPPCLALLGGQEAPTPAVSSVACDTSPPPWWKKKDTATWVTLILGSITALLWIPRLGARLGFGTRLVGPRKKTARAASLQAERRCFPSFRASLTLTRRWNPFPG